MNPLPAVMACLLPVALYLAVRAFLRRRQRPADRPSPTVLSPPADTDVLLVRRHYMNASVKREGTPPGAHSRRNRRIDSRARYICRREEGGSCRTRTLDPPRMGGTRRRCGLHTRARTGRRCTLRIYRFSAAAARKPCRYTAVGHAGGAARGTGSFPRSDNRRGTARTGDIRRAGLPITDCSTFKTQCHETHPRKFGLNARRKR